MFRKPHQARGFFLAFFAAMVLLPGATSSGQVARQSKTSKNPESQPTPDLSRWQYMLDDLALEAKTVNQEDKRPLLIAEVADTYWNLDREKSRGLFVSALDAALALKSGAKESSQALRQVIKLAAKRDSALSQKLTERMVKSAEKEWIDSESLSAALELIDSDPKTAAQLVQATARNGPSLDTAWFIFQLSKRDPVAADHLYRVTLGAVAANRAIGLDRLLWLAGYPFGYAEAFGGTDPRQMAGFSGLRIAGVHATPALAQAFLDVAFVSVQNALQQASSTPEQAEMLNGLALFTTAYLLPEVARHSPRATQAWSTLNHQALLQATALQREAVAHQVKKIVDSRTPTNSEPHAEFDASAHGEDLLGGAEKLPSGCKRDTEYVKAALSVGYAKNFLRAIEIAGKVDNDSMREGVREFLYYDMSVAAIVDDAPVNLVEAQKYAERVPSPEQRALLYVKISRAALRNKDRFAAAELLRKTMRLAEVISEPASQASVLLAAAARFAEFDKHEAYRAIKEAIKAVNRLRNPTVDDFRVLRKVNLSCAGGEDAWYGDSQRSERFSLFETFARMASTDLEGMIYAARELEDPPTRIRSLIAIVKGVTDKPQRSALATQTSRK